MRRIVWLSFWFVACGGGSKKPNPGDGGSSGHPPIASFTAASTVAALTPIAFDAGASSDPDGDALSYHWDFGDGERGGGATLAHAFAAAGSYTVTLTVSDSTALSATYTAAVNVSALSTGAVVPVFVRVVDLTGAPLAGVTLGAPGVTGQSDADGQIAVMIPSGRPYSLALSLAGYAAQFHVLDLTTPPAAPIYLDVTMSPRDAAATFDATAGGSLSARDGAKITLPPNALVDASGAAVTGMITIAMTAINPTLSAGRHAFPGAYVGIAPDATSAPLLSYGTTEYALYRDSERLQLAAGQVATIETPVYATKNTDGASVKAGDSFPLWSLDENSGSWIQEGTGTVVASTDSPSGLALRGNVSHFSWWNCDTTSDGFGDTVTCQCAADDDLCVMLQTETFTCNVTGESADGDSGSPGFVASASEDSGSPMTFGVPAGFKFTISGSAFGGSLSASQSVMGTKGQPQSQTLMLRSPAGTTKTVLADGAVTLPFSEDATFGAAYDVRRYHVTVMPGDLLSASYQPAPGGAAVLAILDGSDAVVQKAAADSANAAVTITATATDYVVQLVSLKKGHGTLSIGISADLSETVSLPFDRTDSFGVGDSHAYKFTVVQTALYQVSWTPTPGVAGTVTVKDSSAQTIGSGILTAAGNLPFSALLAGTYEVDFHAQGPSAIEVQVVQTAGATSSNEIPITLPFSGNPTVPANSSNKYVFTGAPGMVVTALLSDTIYDGHQLRVYPRGQTPLVAVPQQPNTGGGVDSRWGFAIAADSSSDYIVEVTNPNAHSQKYGVLKISAATGTPIALSSSNDVIAGVLPSPAAQVIYTYDANAGDVFAVNLQSSCGGATSFYAQLLSDDGGYRPNDRFSAGTTPDGLVEAAGWSGKQALVFSDLDATVQPCNLTLGLTQLSASSFGKLLDFSVTPGANTLGQQQGAYTIQPADGMISARMVQTSGTGGSNCMSGLRSLVPAGATSNATAYLCTNTGVNGCVSATITNAAAGRVSADVVSGKTDTCAGSVYVWPVASPMPLASPPPSPAPLTTTVGIGQRVFYQIVGDGSTTKRLFAPTVTGGAHANLFVVKADGNTNGLFAGAVAGSITNGQSGAQSSALNLLNGATYYIEVYGDDGSSVNLASTSITWYLQ